MPRAIEFNNKNCRQPVRSPANNIDLKNRFESLPESVFVFIHVYKTGGKSIKDILMHIAGEISNLGFVQIIRGNLTESIDRCGTYTNHERRPITDPEKRQFVRHNIDIVGGHQQFDSANFIWPDLPENAFRKFAYVRNPLHRFVSGIIFTNDRKERAIYNVTDTIEYIRQIDLEEKTNRVRYWKDLATESEVKDPELERNYEKQVEIIKNRLDSLAMVGVVERWNQSLKLLLSIVTPKNSNQKIPDIHKNKSKISTEEVISAIKRDDVVHNKLLEYLKYEQEVYEHGLHLHLQQCSQANIK